MTPGGLDVRQEATGWGVFHAASGLAAATGLRQRRFAEQARDELLATGVDFTQDAAAVQAQRALWSPAYFRWLNRSRQFALDPETWEYYPKHSSYGQVIPSAKRAAELRGETP
jgi:hypothetical protein